MNSYAQSRFNPGIPHLERIPIAPYQGPWGTSVEPNEPINPHEPNEPINPHEPINDETTRGSIRSKISTFLSKGGHV